MYKPFVKSETTIKIKVYWINKLFQYLSLKTHDASDAQNYNQSILYSKHCENLINFMKKFFCLNDTYGNKTASI